MIENHKTLELQYLISADQDSAWGITVHSVGCQQSKVNAIYPPQNHPSRYLFSEDKGRVLEEYQLVYIVNGKGTFISKSSKEVELKQETLFLLFIIAKTKCTPF